MSNRNLIPEARADKNGNVVTRWVKSMFGKEEAGRAIPAPTAAPALTRETDPVWQAERRSARAVFDRWREALGQNESPAYYFSEDTGDWSYPEWAREAMRSEDFAKLGLVEKYAKDYDPEVISVTLDMLRNSVQGEAEHLVTEDHLEAMTILDKVFPRTEVNPLDEDEYFPAMREERLRGYVLNHPAAAHKVEELTSRGIYDPVSILETLESVQDDQIPTPINEGLL